MNGPHQGPSRQTQQELDRDKARLEAAPADLWPQVIKELHAEKRSTDAAADQQEERAKSTAAKDDLLSKLKVSEHGGGFRLTLQCGAGWAVGPVRNSDGMSQDEKQAAADADKARVKDAAWDGICPEELLQLVKGLHPNKPAIVKQCCQI